MVSVLVLQLYLSSYYFLFTSQTPLSFVSKNLNETIAIWTSVSYLMCQNLIVDGPFASILKLYRPLSAPLLNCNPKKITDEPA